MVEAAAKREGRAQNLDQNRLEYEQILEKINAKRLKIDDPGLEIQDAVFDFNVVETSEEEIRIVTQTEEFENLFACRREAVCFVFAFGWPVVRWLIKCGCPVVD